MPYHVHPVSQILGLQDELGEGLEEHKQDPDGHPPFAGPGTTGFVPDPLTALHRALSDTGDWRRATKVFFQVGQPTDAESAAGDLWLVTS